TTSCWNCTAGSRTRGRSPPSLPATARWSSGCAAACWATSTTPRTPSRPPSSSWPAAPRTSATGRRWGLAARGPKPNLTVGVRHEVACVKAARPELPDRAGHVDVGGPHLDDILRPAPAQPLHLDHGPDRRGHSREDDLDMLLLDRADTRLL